MQQASDRVLLAIVIVLVDLFVFVIPVTGLFAAYILVMRPPWFRRWIERLYEA